jgi:hypothetical protein
MNFIQTNFILGCAGTAKTTTIIDTITELDDFVCLAFTHSAVNNLHQKYIKHPKHNSKYGTNFKTIHSYFKINIDNNGQEILRFNTNLYLPKYIFIDELSLIPLHIIEYIYTVLKHNLDLLNDKKIVLTFVGDLLQLNPINVGKQLINPNNFKTLKNFKCNFHESLLIASHLSNNIFSTDYYQNSNKMILTKNYRSNDKVTQILNEVLIDYTNITKYLINLDDINKYVDKGYIILSSKYTYLEQSYSMLNIQKEFKLNTDIGKISYNNNDKLLLTTNLNDHFTNGDTVIIRQESNEIVKLIKNEFVYIFEFGMKKYPLLPLNMLTIHKSQGLTLNKIIVILDDLFEITMLYTAITRASKNVKFIVFNKQNINNLKLYNKCFNRLRKIIYS